MGIQYGYALLTMIPCPIWFWYRWASATFLMVVFTWSVWNGATFYIDVFGMRFSKELEQLKKDVAKWQSTPDLQGRNAFLSPTEEKGNPMASPPTENSMKAMQKASMGEAGESVAQGDTTLEQNGSIAQIPSLKLGATGADTERDESGMMERRSG